MTHNELRQFLKEANALKLSPMEKDVFQYYFSRAQNENGEWYCPDAETAEEISRSRNGVCAARLDLIKKGWIEEPSTFVIRVVKTFSVRNQTEPPPSVSNQTENGGFQSETGLKPEIPSPKSDSSVRNQTQTGEIPVRNQTLYKEKGNLKEFKGKQEEPQDARARGGGGGETDSENFENPEKTDYDGIERIGGFSLGEYAELLVSHSRKVLGVITLPNEAAQMKPIEWLWRNKASPIVAISCYDEIRKQGWRASKVDWKTVSEEFPDWKYRRDNPNELVTVDEKIPKTITVGKSENPVDTEIKPLGERGRDDALEQLREYADSPFLNDFEKFYTGEDWKWLSEQLVLSTEKSTAVSGWNDEKQS